MKPNRFRFRAWNKCESKMCRVAAVYGNVDDPTMIGATLIFEQPGMVEYRDSMNRSIVLMQSTGLADKNGKEIFEGDILVYIDRRPNVVHSPITVDWCRDKAKLSFIGRGYTIPPGCARNMIVAGNIHEHPHLLGK